MKNLVINSIVSTFLFIIAAIYGFCFSLKINTFYVDIIIPFVFMFTFFGMIKEGK